MRVTLALDTLGILSGIEKRTLEDYVDLSNFTKRKQYDEYIVHGEVKADLELADLMVLAEKFTIEVCSDGIALKNTE